MREVRRQALVPYTPSEMDALVNDVARYPEFLPWCPGARVLRQDGPVIEAAIDIARGPVGSSFTTRNTRVPGERLEMRLLDGPFSALEGTWTFKPLGDPARPEGCKVELLVRFAFKSGVLGMALSPVFEASCNTLVDAFVQRARQVYGPR
ncbi:MAG: type II toxin-antitoxin system RatA family toxin [Gammaproteobacteria bacterium]